MSVPTPSACSNRAADFSGVELFVDSARRVKLDFNLAGEAARRRRVASAPSSRGCRWPSYWPPRGPNVLTLEEIAGEISEGFEFLAADRRDAPTRQHSIRSVFDHSWTLLGADERALFSRLGVFRGGFTRASAQAVAGATCARLRRWSTSRS